MTTPTELPHDLDAEKAVLGGILMSETALFEVADLIVPLDFYMEAHRIIFEQALAMVSDEISVDLVTMSSRLASKDLSKRIGGVVYLSSLADSLPDVTNSRHYARIIKDHATKRKLVQFGRAIATVAGGSGEAKDALDEAMSSLLTITGTGRESESRLIVDVARDVLEDARALAEGNIDDIGVRTGFATLDDYVFLRHGKVCVIAGATSSGKTSLALQIADMVSTKGKTVAFFSMEMSAEEVGARVIAAGTGTDTRMIEQKATPVIVERIEGFLPNLEGRNLFIDDSVDVTPFDIRAKARQIQMRHGLDLVVIDYLQLMSYRGRNRSRQEEVSAMSREVKLAAKSLGVPVLLLSQLSRKHLEERRKPELRDLRESGSIENDADIVLMIYRANLKESGAEVLVKKQRQGPLGSIQMDFDGPTQRFREVGYNPADLDNSVKRVYPTSDTEEFDERDDSDGDTF